MTKPGSSESKVTTIGAGQNLFRQDEKGGELFFIQDGQVELSVRDPHTGHSAVVAIAGPRSVLGTMSFLEGEPRSATAKALTEVKCVIITDVQRERLLDDVPIWFRVLVKDLSGNLRKLNKDYANLKHDKDLLEQKLAALKNKEPEKAPEPKKTN